MSRLAANLRCLARRSIFVVAAMLLLPSLPLQADVKLPSIFSNGMVLQRDQAVPVWGWADAGEKVTVAIAGQTHTATAGKDGAWKVKLGALVAGGPYTLTVKGKNTLTLDDVLAGEVWLCSGQSNMAMTVNRALNFDQEAAAADLPQIRQFKVAGNPKPEPQTDCNGSWVTCSPETVGGFSATAYFFGRRLNKELGVPVGLINSSVGGTPVEAWTSLAAQEADPRLAPVLDSYKKAVAEYDPAAAQAAYEAALERWEKLAARNKEQGKPAPRKPKAPVAPSASGKNFAVLYNGMIAPLVGYGIRGAIWYQGENNAGRGLPYLYDAQLETLISDWRTRWGQGDFAFLWAQLPNYRTPQKEPVETTGWVVVQDCMRRTLSVPNTGMAVNIEVGEANDIHPKNKQAVGSRLAQWALGMVYGGDEVLGGPIYKSSTIKGNTVTVQFDNVGAGLAARDGEKLTGFAIAGEDKKFVAAEAKIDGNTVVVSSPQVKQATSVRYGWSANPDCNLINQAGLPASPFRTDDWDLKAELGQ